MGCEVVVCESISALTLAGWSNLDRTQAFQRLALRISTDLRLPPTFGGTVVKGRETKMKHRMV